MGAVVSREGLLAGLPVPAKRLDSAWVKALGLRGDVVLDDELALRVGAPWTRPHRAEVLGIIERFARPS